MNPLTMIRLSVVSLFLLSSVKAEDWSRQISSEFNPGCPVDICNGNISVVYSKANGPSDTLHYLWDLSKKPSLLLALTPLSTNLSIDWERYGNSCALSFSEKPSYIFGVIINTIWEFNDVNDTGILDFNNKSSKYVKELHTGNFAWHKTVYNNRDSRSVSLTVKADKYKDGLLEKNGSVEITVTGFGYSDHSSVLPHLLHTPNSTQVDFVIDGLSTEPSFSNSRFAVELVLVGSDQPASSVQILERQCLDDEHAPGVFRLVDLESPRSAEMAQGGYLEWRPVAYISRVRELSNSTETYIYNAHNVSHPEELLKGSLIQSAFCVNDSVSVAPLVQATAVSFGLKEDGFYRKTKYTAWTFTLGYGKPPNEEFSLLVILVISIGLGLPALLILISGLVMLIRRVSQKKDDLFLGR